MCSNTELASPLIKMYRVGDTNKKWLTMKRVLLLMFLLVATVGTQAQNDDFFKRTGFDEFRKSIFDDYKDFRTKMLKDYTDFLRKAWSEFYGIAPVDVPDEEPVPPVVKPDGEEVVESRPVDVVEVVTPKPVEPQPEPVVRIDEVPRVRESYVDFTFFGTAARVRFDIADKVKLGGTSENAVADAFEAMATKSHDNMILDCLALRKELKLSDWAYLQMINELAKVVYCDNANGVALLTAYLFMQSGYKVRMGSCDGRLYMLFACDNLIYERVAYNVGGCRFYGIEPLPAQMNICEAAFEKEKAMSLTVAGGQRFAYSASQARKISSKTYPAVSVEVAVNRNLLEFYDTYPTSMVGDDMYSRWALYANTPIDKPVRDGLYPQLRAALEGLSQVEAVTRILAFVQTGFDYEYDNEVWGYDRVFFAEESLFYPYCDCEDRSVLFTRLVRDLIGIETVLVIVPGHMLAAVCMDEKVDGAYMELDGRKFVLCEPTCLNGAPLGWADIPDGAKMQVVMLE